MPVPSPDVSEDFETYVRCAKRRTRWRVHSRACAGVDVVVAVAGAGLMVLTAVDSVVSWPTGRVLVDHHALSRLAGAVILPGWIWLLGSLGLLFGRPGSSGHGGERQQDRQWERMLGRAMYPRTRTRVGFGLVGVLCVGVVVGGFVAGAAKGDARVRPGPRYEVATMDLDSSAWTPVTAAQYDVWQARFVREDGVLTLFGLALAAGSSGLLRLHRTVGPRPEGAATATAAAAES